MTLLGFIRLVIRKLPWLVIFPSMIAGLVIYLTKNIEREYVSSTIMYTGIASGYDITETDAMRIDYFAVNNSFDNLINTVKSRETIEDVAMKLLTQHLMLKNPDPIILSEKGFQRLNNLVTAEERKQLVVPGNFDSTYARVYRMRISSSENVVANLLNKVHRDNMHYMVSSITNRLTVNRKGSSDMLEMNFRSTDPGVTMHTLKFLLESAQKRYRGVKGAETSNVVKYFEEQLRRALEDLRAAEERLKTFGVENRIINYYEQAKYIAASNEEIKNEYYKEMMAYEASKAAVDRLETRMEDRGLVVTTNREFLDLRRKLSETLTQLTNAEIYGAEPEELERLNEEAQDLREQFDKKAREYYNNTYDMDAVAQQNLLNEWLNNVILNVESEARLLVFEKRLKEFDKDYDQFAPLGSEMTRLDREVDVAEKEYLSILHGLNNAKLRQTNLQMANSLTVMDEPYYPLVPLPSKRLIMVIASFMVGFILLLSFFVANEMLDHAVRTPEKAAEASGLALGGALPVLRRKKNNLVFDELEYSLTEQLITSTTIAMHETEKVSTYYQVNIVSARYGEGKTWVAQRLANRYAQTGGKILYLYPETSQLHDLQMDEKVTTIAYPVTGALIEAEGLQTLLEGTGHTTFEFAYIFLELPDISHNSVPYNLVNKAHVSLLVMNAEKAWGKAHERSLSLYLKAAKNKVMLVLNRVTPDMLESVYGELPKKRSTMRKVVKRMVNMGSY